MRIGGCRETAVVVVVCVLISTFISVLAQAEQSYVITRILPNGMRVVLIPAQTNHTVLMTRVGVGFFDEKVGSDPSQSEAGISHWLEHLLHRGTKVFPSKQIYDQTLKQLGIQYNASTLDVTRYFFIVPNQNVGPAMRIQADMLAAPLLTDTDILNEAHPVRQELGRRSKNTHVDLWQAALAGHGYGRAAHYLAGTADDMNIQSPEMMRDFFNRYYSATNMVLVVIGRVDAEIERSLDEYSRIPNYRTPPHASAKPSFLRAPDKTLKLLKVKTTPASTRLFDIRVPLDATWGNVEQTAQVLAKFLNRPGSNSIFDVLYKEGLINPGPAGRTNSFSVEKYLDVVFLRLALDLTAKGEVRSEEVLKKVFSLFGTVAKEGLPPQIIEEIKSATIKELEHVGILQLAERLSDNVATYGPERLANDINAIMDVKRDDIQTLASNLVPQAARITLVSPSVKGERHPLLKRETMEVDLTAKLPLFEKEFMAAQFKLDSRSNRWLHSMPYGVQKKGLSLVIAPEYDSTDAKAILTIKYPDKLSDSERLAFDLAIESFRLEPEIARFIHSVEEAFGEVDFSFDPDEGKLSISVDGHSSMATDALAILLSKIRQYEPSDEALKTAKRYFVESLRDLPAAEVGAQAVGIAFSDLLKGRPDDLGKQIEAVQKVDMMLVKRALTLTHDSWSVTGVMAGNWNNASIRQTIPLLESPNPQEVELKEHDPKRPNLPQQEHLLGRIAEVERQGAARLLVVDDLKAYSKAHWDFEVFVRMLNNRLLQVLRDDMKITYNANVGFQILPQGGAVYMYSDTDQKAMKLAMGFSVALESVFFDGVTEAEFDEAKTEVMAKFKRMASGAEGLNNAQFDPDFKAAAMQSAAYLNAMTPQTMYADVVPRIETAIKRDAVAVGKNDPSCETLLMLGGKNASLLPHQIGGPGYRSRSKMRPTNPSGSIKISFAPPSLRKKSDK